ncbi:methyltransferase family protein [Allofournierella sp.]|uniref:methyltransferase family protein n=1 Tax=Allofournierella sp. TaxID=1940256 RepID=UPI003AB2BD09
MNAFLLMIPLFLIRFGLLGALNREAVGRAARFAPLEGKERMAYLFYQVSNLFLILYPAFLKVQAAPPLFWAGLGVYIAGIAVLAATTAAFARPDEKGLNTAGVYKLSRNPMYVGYFLDFLGCAVLARSLLLFAALLVFQTAGHWIVLSEERWCAAQFGEEYRAYMKRVRRYI